MEENNRNMKKEENVNKEVKSKKTVNRSTLIFVVVIFILIIALLVAIYFGFLRKDETDNNKNNTNVNNEIIDNNTTNNTMNNAVSNTVSTNDTKTNTTQSRGKNLDLNSTEVKNIVSKFNFGFASHSLYKVGDFDLSNIPNELVLRFGWMKVKNEDRVINGELLQEKVSREKVEQSIKNLFGNNIKYTDKSFRYSDVDTFSSYATDKVYYNNEYYTAQIFQGGGAPDPFVYEEVQNAEKFDDRIELYVKTAFVDVTVRKSGDYGQSVDFSYDFYKNFNFNREEFENKLISVDEADYYEGDNGEHYQLSLKTHKAISSIMNKLDTYKYTFSLDKSTGEYYFSGFEKVK